METIHSITGRILGKDKDPLENIKIKAYDEKGMFITSVLSDKDGNIKFECGVKPKFIKATKL